MIRTALIAALCAVVLSSNSNAQPSSEWERFFAVRPVEVDAYDASEIKNGKFRYRKVGWVQRRWKTVSDEDGLHWEGWVYRLDRSVRGSSH